MTSHGRQEGTGQQQISAMDVGVDFFQKMAELIEEDAKRRGLLARSEDAAAAPMRGARPNEVAPIDPAQAGAAARLPTDKPEPPNDRGGQSGVGGRTDIDPMEILQAAHRLVTQRMDLQSTIPPAGCGASRAATLATVGQQSDADAVPQRCLDSLGLPWAGMAAVETGGGELASKESAASGLPYREQDLQNDGLPNVGKKVADVPAALTEAFSATGEPLPEPGPATGSAPDTPATKAVSRSPGVQPWAAAWTPSPAQHNTSKSVAPSASSGSVVPLRVAEPWAAPWEPKPAVDRHAGRIPLPWAGMRSFAEAAADESAAPIKPADVYPHSRGPSPIAMLQHGSSGICGGSSSSTCMPQSRSSGPSAPPPLPVRPIAYFENRGSFAPRGSAAPSMPTLPERAVGPMVRSEDRGGTCGVMRNALDRSLPPSLSQRPLPPLTNADSSTRALPHERGFSMPPAPVSENIAHCGRSFPLDQGTAPAPPQRYSPALGFHDDGVRGGRLAPLMPPSPVAAGHVQPLGGRLLPHERAGVPAIPHERSGHGPPSMTQMQPSWSSTRLPNAASSSTAQLPSERAVLERAVLPEPQGAMQNLPALRPPASPPRRKSRPQQSDSPGPSLPALTMRGPR